MSNEKQHISVPEIEKEIHHKLNSIKKNTKDSLHHIMAKSRKSEWYRVDESDNHIILWEDLHQKFHNLFWNLLPHEQLLVWIIINNSVMSEKVLDILGSIELDEFYKEDLEYKEIDYDKKFE